MHVIRLIVGLIPFGMMMAAPLIAQAQLKPDKRLTQKISIDYDKTPADEVLKELSDKYKLPIDLIGEAADLIEGYPITLSGDGVMLGSVLHWICESHYAVSYIEKGRLRIARIDEDEKILTPRQYPLAGIVPAIDPQVLANVYLPQFTSGKWKAIDEEGGDVLAMSPQAITILQSRAAHAELQDFFQQLSAAGTNRPRLLTPQEKVELALLRKLQTPVQLAPGEFTLKEFLDQLLKKEQFAYAIDVTSLMDESIDLQKLKVTVDDTKQSAESRLDALAAEHKLSWRFADEFVQIASQDKGAEQMSIRVYDIRKKIAPNQPAEALMQKLLGDKELGPWQVNDDVGGAFIVIGNWLVIRHNSAAHSKIAKLIN